MALEARQPLGMLFRSQTIHLDFDSHRLKEKAVNTDGVSFIVLDMEKMLRDREVPRGWSPRSDDAIQR